MNSFDDRLVLISEPFIPVVVPWVWADYSVGVINVDPDMFDKCATPALLLFVRCLGDGLRRACGLLQGSWRWSTLGWGVALAVWIALALPQAGFAKNQPTNNCGSSHDSVRFTLDTDKNRSNSPVDDCDTDRSFSYTSKPYVIFEASMGGGGSVAGDNCSNPGRASYSFKGEITGGRVSFESRILNGNDIGSARETFASGGTGGTAHLNSTFTYQMNNGVRKRATIFSQIYVKYVSGSYCGWEMRESSNSYPRITNDDRAMVLYAPHIINVQLHDKWLNTGTQTVSGEAGQVLRIIFDDRLAPITATSGIRLFDHDNGVHIDLDPSTATQYTVTRSDDTLEFTLPEMAY
jgi:hypothetical protein